MDLFNLTNDGETNKGPKKFDDVLIETLTYAEKAYKKALMLPCLKQV